MNEAVSFADFWSLFWPAITAAAVSAVMCGVLGVFVVLRRIAFVSAALGQVAGLGVAGGFLVGTLFGHDPHDPTPLWLDPVLVALALSALVAGLLSLLPRVRRAPPESVVAFAYLFASALTVIVLASPLILQEAHEIGDLLFGSSVAIRNEHLIELVVVAVGVLLSQLFMFRSLLFVSFDPEMARALGLPVRRLELFLHLSIGVGVAVATRAVGALPVFGLLVLPAGAALLASQRIRTVLLLSVGGALVAAVGGFYLSYLASWPTGPTMVVTAAAFWPLALAARVKAG